MKKENDMKIIASDFDGTLVHHGVISDEDRAAINRFRAEGNIFLVITGRGYPSIEREMKSRSMEYDYLIAHNGCTIYDRYGDLCYEEKAEGEILPELISMFMKHNGHNTSFGRQLNRYEITDVPKEKQGETSYIFFDEVKQYPYFNQADAYFDSIEIAVSLNEDINRRFDGKITSHLNGRNINAVPYGVSKSSGLEAICRYTGVAYKDCIAIGDDYNDIDMIRDFNGVTLPNGRDEVKAIARKVVGSIYELVEEMIGKE